MSKKAVLLLTLLALLLTGCGALEEGIEAEVEALIEEHEEEWFEHWFTTFRVEDLPAELPMFLALVIAVATIGALWAIPSDDYGPTIRWLTIVLGISIFVMLPELITSFERLFLGDFKLSELFEGMNWVEEIVDVGSIIGPSWEETAATLALNLPYYHTIATDITIMVFLGCMLGTAVVGNTRPLMFSAIQLAGVAVFPLAWKILAVSAIALPRLEILGLFSSSKAINAGFIFGTLGLMAFFYLGLPLILALALPAFDFKGQKLDRPPVRGVFERGVERGTEIAGGLTGLAGRIQDRRAYAEARATGSVEGDNGVSPVAGTPSPGPEGPPPSEDSSLPSGKDAREGVLPEVDTEPASVRRAGTDIHTERATEEMVPQAEGAILMASQQADQELVQPGKPEELESRASEGALPETSDEVATVTRDAPQSLESDGVAAAAAITSATLEHQEHRDLADIKSALDAQTRMLEGSLKIAAAGSTLAGHPELGMALSGAASVISQARGSFLPEFEGAPNLHRRSDSMPPVIEKRSASFLPEGGSA